MANREQRPNKEKKKPKSDKNKVPPPPPATPFGNAPNRNPPKPSGKK